MKSYFVVTRRKGHAWQEAKPMDSQTQWPEHAQFMNQLAANGFIILGDPLRDSGHILLVVNAADEATIQATLARDPWSQAGLLEVQSIQHWTILLAAE